MYNLIAENTILAAQKEIVIETNKKGSLTVYNELQEQDTVCITAPIPEHIGTNLDKTSIAENLGISAGQISDTFPLDVIEAGLKTLIAPISLLENEINIFPKEQILKSFCLSCDIDIILIFSNETADKRNIAHTRVFAPKFGYLEDPATGSGNRAFGYYMLKDKLWDGSRFQSNKAAQTGPIIL